MRDEQLLGLRPKLDLNTEESTELESFQNITLRPILKYQHQLTKRMLDHSSHFAQMKEKFDNSDLKRYGEMVDKYVSSNIVFKNKLVGAMLGMMTVEEFAFFHENRSELTKRIVSMQVQRYVDTKDEVMG